MVGLHLKKINKLLTEVFPEIDSPCFAKDMGYWDWGSHLPGIRIFGNEGILGKSRVPALCALFRRRIVHEGLAPQADE